MTTKYEIIEIDRTEITVDVSLLTKSEELWFNATQIAKNFGKRVQYFLNNDYTQEYIEEILNDGNPAFKNISDLVQIKKGKYGGTWLHNELAFEFAGWCSAIFRRNLHKWVEDRLKEEQSKKLARLEAKTGFLPMTNAILNAHDQVKPHHFSNEADLINRIVLGIPSKKFKAEHCVSHVRDACTAAQLQDIKKLQAMNTSLIDLGMDYTTRKDVLTRYYKGETNLLVNAA